MLAFWSSCEKWNSWLLERVSFKIAKVFVDICDVTPNVTFHRRCVGLSNATCLYTTVIPATVALCSKCTKTQLLEEQRAGTDIWTKCNKTPLRCGMCGTTCFVSQKVRAAPAVACIYALVAQLRLRTSAVAQLSVRAELC